MVKILNATQLVPQKVPRITTRVHAQASLGTVHTTVWEQWIDSRGFIPLHYHDTEEVIAILSGCLVLRMAEEEVRLAAPATIILAAHEIHGIRVDGDATVHLIAAFPTAVPQIFDPDGQPRPLPQHDEETTSDPS